MGRTGQPVLRVAGALADRALRRFLQVGFGFMVRRSLRGVWLRGELPPGGFVWAANHHSWWDAFVAAAVLWQQGRELTVMVDPATLLRFRFLRRMGVLATGELRRALAQLRAGRVLVIFPEGVLCPPGPLAPLEPGAAWLAARAQVPLVAVAVRILLRGHQAPEAYLEARQVTGALEPALSQQLADLDAALRGSDPRMPLPGFSQLVRGRLSWDERLDWGWSWR